MSQSESHLVMYDLPNASRARIKYFPRFYICTPSSFFPPTVSVLLLDMYVGFASGTNYCAPRVKDEKIFNTNTSHSISNVKWVILLVQPKIKECKDISALISQSLNNYMNVLSFNSTSRYLCAKWLGAYSGLGLKTG